MFAILGGGTRTLREELELVSFEVVVVLNIFLLGDLLALLSLLLVGDLAGDFAGVV